MKRLGRVNSYKSLQFPSSLLTLCYKPASPFSAPQRWNHHPLHLSLYFLTFSESLLLAWSFLERSHLRLPWNTIQRAVWVNSTVSIIGVQSRTRISGTNSPGTWFYTRHYSIPDYYRRLSPLPVPSLMEDSQRPSNTQTVTGSEVARLLPVAKWESWEKLDFSITVIFGGYSTHAKTKATSVLEDDLLSSI